MPKIEYFEKDGELWFSYEEHVSVPTKAHKAVWQVFESSGKVPQDIVKQGEEAIKKHTQQKIKRAIKAQKAKAQKQEEYEKNPDFPVSTEYGNKILKGRIVSAEDETLTVRLEEPYQGEIKLHYGWASAMSCKYIFASHRKFSKSALESARQLLIDIYKKQKYYEEHKEVIDLAEKLSKE